MAEYFAKSVIKFYEFVLYKCRNSGNIMCATMNKISNYINLIILAKLIHLVNMSRRIVDKEYFHSEYLLLNLASLLTSV